MLEDPNKNEGFWALFLSEGALSLLIIFPTVLFIFAKFAFERGRF